jgi:hypothetical protein
MFEDICWLRLDFETFSIVGPTTTSEVDAPTAGGNCPDQFKVTVEIILNISKILTFSDRCLLMIILVNLSRRIQARPYQLFVDQTPDSTVCSLQT